MEGLTKAREHILEAACARGGVEVTGRQMDAVSWLKDAGFVTAFWRPGRIAAGVHKWTGNVRATAEGRALMHYPRPRPPVPVKVKLRVVLRQLGELWPDEAIGSMSGNLDGHLEQLLIKLAGLLGCTVEDLRLDHEPQLSMRAYNRRVAAVADRYTPNANDPDALLYRPHGREFAGSHDTKTNVAGDHGQLSDTAMRKKARKIARRQAAEAMPRRKRRAPRVKRKIPSRPFAKRRPKQ